MHPRNKLRASMHGSSGRIEPEAGRSRLRSSTGLFRIGPHKSLGERHGEGNPYLNSSKCRECPVPSTEARYTWPGIGGLASGDECLRRCGVGMEAAAKFLEWRLLELLTRGSHVLESEQAGMPAPQGRWPAVFPEFSRH
jgi:hypothetical protein